MYAGRTESAREYSERSFGIYKELAVKTGTVYAQNDLAKGYEYLGFLNSSTGRLEPAKEYDIKALDIQEKLVKKTGNLNM